jgi:hypothetical protein
MLAVWPDAPKHFRVSLTKLVKGRATVVREEVFYAPTPEEAARLALLYFQAVGVVTGLAIERLRDAVRVSNRNPGWDEDGYDMEDNLDGFQGFDGSEPHPFSVSTLVPGLHGKPFYKYFDTFETALVYARDRARKGKKLREGGKAYFIMSQDSETPAYRVFRGNLGAEHAPGAKHYTEKREFVLVQKADGKIKGYPDRTHWVLDKASSVEILIAEVEKARSNMPSRQRAVSDTFRLPKTQYGDAEDRAAFRLADLKARGINAKIVLKVGKIFIRLPNGTYEEP